MEKSYHLYEDIAPVMSNYSRAVRAGDFFFITGTTAGGSDAAQGDLPAQLRETLDRIRRILEREGRSITDVVKFNTFVTSIQEWQDRGDEINAIFAELFHGNYPAHTLIGCTELAGANLKVEIEATAAF